MGINDKGSRNERKRSNDRVYYQYSLRDFFALYTDREFKSPATKKQYQGFLLDFFAEIFKEIVYNRWTFYIPFRLGFITLRSAVSNLRSAPTDRSRLEKGKRPVLTNDHSYRRVYSMKWVTKFVRFKNGKYYRFKPWTSAVAFERYGTGTKAISHMINEASTDPTKKLIA